jgi:hypothetical protein
MTTLCVGAGQGVAIHPGAAMTAFCVGAGQGVAMFLERP